MRNEADGFKVCNFCILLASLATDPTKNIPAVCRRNLPSVTPVALETASPYRSQSTRPIHHRLAQRLGLAPLLLRRHDRNSSFFENEEWTIQGHDSFNHVVPTFDQPG